MVGGEPRRLQELARTGRLTISGRGTRQPLAPGRGVVELRGKKACPARLTRQEERNHSTRPADRLQDFDPSYQSSTRELPKASPGPTGFGDGTALGKHQLGSLRSRGRIRPASKDTIEKSFEEVMSDVR